MKLNSAFYTSEDVVGIARALLGKILYVRSGSILTGGIITETEAYNGVSDRASHAYGGRRTQRTEVMYAEGGVAYVYLCYGIHSLLNVVTGVQSEPQAVLIRSIFPSTGIEVIRKRRKVEKTESKLCIGPGTVSQALGVRLNDTGSSLLNGRIWIEDRKINVDSSMIISGKRIGVEYAGKDANLPWRFRLDHDTIERDRKHFLLEQ